MTSKESFKQLVETVSKSTGKTQEELAKGMGYSKTYISESLAPTGKLSEKFVSAFKKQYLGNPKNGSIAAPPVEGFIPAREHIQELKKHNEILASVIQTNLTALLSTQRIILAEVKASARWEARKLAKGDPKKERQYLGEVSTLVGEYLRSFEKSGTHAETHT